MEHPDFLKVVRVFAEADASVAWCINQNNVFSTNAVRVPEETATEIWTVQRNVVTNGPPVAGSRADVVEGGYHLSGTLELQQRDSPRDMGRGAGSGLPSRP